MLPFFDGFRETDLLATTIKMLLAVLCGGLIGIEREYKRRPAGFRTHILICLGAAMMTMTSQFLALEMKYNTDIARLGAQVVAGIGFIGAGTIIVTRYQRVKGLTTAAGLWAAAIVGLALGAGFYEGGLFATLLILLAETFFSKLEYYIMRHTPEVNLYMQYTDRVCLEEVLRLLQQKNVRVLNMEITRSPGNEQANAYVVFFLRMDKKYSVDTMLLDIRTIKGVLSVEEI